MPVGHINNSPVTFRRGNTDVLRSSTDLNILLLQIYGHLHAFVLSWQRVMSSLFLTVVTILIGTRYSRDFFNRYRDLKHIRCFRFWPLDKVLIEKYEFSVQDASGIADFLIPILDFVLGKRPTAAQCLLHPWINAGPHLLEPYFPAAETKAVVDDNSDGKKREKDAMELLMRNITIGEPSKSVK